MLKLRELKMLPFQTLSVMAIAVARDIDNGDDKHELLKNIFKAIRQ